MRLSGDTHQQDRQSGFGMLTRAWAGARGRAGRTEFCLALEREAGRVIQPPLLGPKLEGRESMSVLGNIFLLALSNKILQCVYYHLDARGSPSREFYLRLSSQGLDFAPQNWCQKHCAELE